MIPIVAAVLFAGACSSDPSPKVSDGAVTSTTVKAAGMTYAECQKSAEYSGQDGYSGGVYAFEFDNGVCKVQRP